MDAVATNLNLMEWLDRKVCPNNSRGIYFFSVIGMKLFVYILNFIIFLLNYTYNIVQIFFVLQWYI